MSHLLRGRTISTSENKLTALNLQSSCYGATIAWGWGVYQVSGNLLWYGGLKQVPHTQTQGGKGGVKQSSTSYSYTSDLMMSMCSGRVTSVPRVWRGKSLYSGGVTPSQLVNIVDNWTTPGSGTMSFTLTHASTLASFGGITRSFTAPDGTTTTIPLQVGSDYTLATGGVVTVVNQALRNVALAIAYQYTSSTPVTTALDALGLTLLKGDIGQSAWTGLAGYGTQSIGYSGLAAVAGAAYDLGTDATVENHKFEIVGAWAYHLGTSVPDIDPTLAMREMLSDARRGANFRPTSMDGWASWSDYCVANNLLMSPMLDQQMSAADAVNLMARLTNTAPVWSGGRLKMVPYGDASATGNGRTFTPNTTPVYDLGDELWTPERGVAPLTYSLKSSADMKNIVRIEYLDRTQQYAPAIAEASDLTDISVNGPRPMDVIQAHWIHDGNIARQVAQHILQRSLYVPRTYKAPLPWHYALLEPMDLVTLTDAPLRLNRLPARTITINESESGLLQMEFEDYPAGVCTPALYSQQALQGFQHNYEADPGPVQAPLFIEPPARFADQTGLALWIAVTAQASYPSWGGCFVWISHDGTNYELWATVREGARYGTTTSSLTSTGLSVGVSLAGRGGQILSGTESDARLLNTLLMIDGEAMAHGAATLTGTNAYTLAGLNRGAYNTPAVAHSSGAPFVRLDDTLAKSTDLDRLYLGETLYFKFQSFNIYGRGLQDLSACTAYSYTMTGTQALSGGQAPVWVSATGVATGVQLTWTIPVGTDGNPRTGTTLVERAPDVSGAPGTWAQINAVPNATTWLDPVTGGAAYWYRLRFQDGRGNVSAYSSLQKVTASSGSSGTGSSGLSASASPASPYYYRFVTGNTTPGNTYVSTTVTPSGGTGPYTYSWARVSGDTFTLSAPSSAATSFGVSGFGHWSAVYRCTVTDSASHTTTVDVNVSITVENGN